MPVAAVVCTLPEVVEVTALMIVHLHAKLELTEPPESTSWLNRAAVVQNWLVVKRLIVQRARQNAEGEPTLIEVWNMLCNYMIAKLETIAGGGKPARLSGEDMSHCSSELGYWTATEDILAGYEDGIESCIPLVQVCGKAEAQILMAQMHGKLTE